MAQLLSKYEQLLPDWAAPIVSELEMVERKLEASVTTDVAAAFDISVRLLSAGGKRVRPALVILSALASGREPDIVRVINLAAAIELIHMASLVHDDVVDQRLERRGVPTANATWDNKLSVLGGDFLVSKAFSLVAADGDVEIIRTLSAIAVKMTESEVLQAACEGSLALWRANYDRIILDKTARLMGACCECGAIVAGASPTACKSLRDYGIRVGLAFQITDDVLDITGDPSRTGKETGTDITSGKFTLPILIATNKEPALAEILRKEMISGQDAAEAAEITIACGADKAALSVASDHTDHACRQLYTLPHTAYLSALETLASFIVDRKS